MIKQAWYINYSPVKIAFLKTLNHRSPGCVEVPWSGKKSETNDRMFQVNVKVQQIFIKFAPHKKTVPLMVFEV